MSAQKDGGPAFPGPMDCTTDGTPVWTGEVGETGMSLRDYFAAKAMQGWLASFTEANSTPPGNGIARYAYEVADAMLKARAS